MSSLATSLVSRAAELASEQGKALCGALHEMYEELHVSGHMLKDS